MQGLGTVFVIHRYDCARIRDPWPCAFRRAQSARKTTYFERAIQADDTRVPQATKNFLFHHYFVINIFVPNPQTFDLPSASIRVIMTQSSAC